MEQEAVIVEDLLLCMLVSADSRVGAAHSFVCDQGVEGKFIKTPSLTDKQAQRSFHIDRSLGRTCAE
jgi:hypothetical protein